MNERNAPKGELVFIFSVREPFAFLAQQLTPYDNSMDFTNSVLVNLLEDVIGTETTRDPVGSNFDEAIRQMNNAGMPIEHARQVAIQAGDMIINEAVAVVPNLGSEVYRNAYEYFHKEPYDVYLHIQRSVFENGPNEVRGRPYRL